jgi:hypothetical protein
MAGRQEGGRQEGRQAGRKEVRQKGRKGGRKDGRKEGEGRSVKVGKEGRNEWRDGTKEGQTFKEGQREERKLKDRTLSVVS